MFSPLDILYIVLAFCALWLTAAIFWLVWQIAMIIKNINDTMAMAQETMSKIEAALTGIRSKFDNASGALGSVVQASTQVIDYILEKKKKKTTRSRSKKKDDVIDV